MESLFHAGVIQIEPLLQKASPQQDRQRNRLPDLACLRVMRIAALRGNVNGPK
jgi:hypothetical protein